MAARVLVFMIVTRSVPPTSEILFIQKLFSFDCININSGIPSLLAPFLQTMRKVNKPFYNVSLNYSKMPPN